MGNRNWLWLLWVVYVGALLFAPSGMPFGGEPVWQIQPETWQEIKAESLNFFFVLPLLNRFGMEMMLAPVLNPVDEALFNVAVAWMFMFLPVLWCDRRGEHLPRTVLWSLGMFLTNVFLIPYMALRRQISPKPFVPQQKLIARGFAFVALVVGMVAFGWFGLARPEFGDGGDRLQYFLQQMTDSRLSIAFIIDLICFWLFQIFLLGDLNPKDSIWQSARFIPFFGMAFWLIL
ncbi:hypothetical protein [[Limnothrix rosea] IAM M-220]|uniref:hypothetical protein n=1 Tax=[Limnothrix rosea] IAM M-220 TaxID=454133 RepID=UPI000965DD90|nr:hypothetical protein [[Limnothrix rosea] IAM M-220]OKH19198.1 hypothetical protein NIES208_02810 [[Limnothrix rosea] IAM M-220]